MKEDKPTEELTRVFNTDEWTEEMFAWVKKPLDNPPPPDDENNNSR